MVNLPSSADMDRMGTREFRVGDYIHMAGEVLCQGEIIEPTAWSGEPAWRVRRIDGAEFVIAQRFAAPFGVA